MKWVITCIVIDVLFTAGLLYKVYGDAELWVFVAIGIMLIRSVLDDIKTRLKELQDKETEKALAKLTEAIDPRKP